MRDGRIGAVEALVRWRHPRRGVLLPGQFLPAAERTGTIKPVCEWALGAARSRTAAAGTTRAFLSTSPSTYRAGTCAIRC